MARVRRSIEIAAPPSVVFHYVADHRNALSWMVGFSEFAAVGEQTLGQGAKVRASGRLVGVPVSTILEIVEFVENDRLVSTSDGPVRSRTTWAFAPTAAGTLVTFSGEYRIHGLPVPAFGEHLLAHEVAAHTTLSLRRLKRVLEARHPDGRSPRSGDGLETPGERC